jgi:hypothetical protein
MTNLVKYDAARTALSEAHAIDEVKDIRDKAEAMAAYARQAKDTEMIQWVTEIKVRAEQKFGVLSRDIPTSQGRRVTSIEGESKSKTEILEAMGASKSFTQRCEKLAAIPNDKFEEAVAAAKESAGEVTTAYMLRVEKQGVIAALHTGDEESYTPAEYIESARIVLGGIDLDPASNPMANETVKAHTYYTATNDGLAKNWEGKVWMNPPYTARVINTFLEKLCYHFEVGEVECAIALTNNNTDTSWFHKTMESASAVCFTSGRINFMKRDGSTSSPTNGQMFLYLGDDVVAFKKEFSKYGLVMVKL